MKPFRSEKIGYDIFLFLSLQSFEEGRVSVQVHDPSIPMFYERLSIFGGKFMKIRIEYLKESITMDINPLTTKFAIL